MNLQFITSLLSTFLLNSNFNVQFQFSGMERKVRASVNWCWLWTSLLVKKRQRKFSPLRLIDSDKQRAEILSSSSRRPTFNNDSIANDKDISLERYFPMCTHYIFHVRELYGCSSGRNAAVGRCQEGKWHTSSIFSRDFFLISIIRFMRFSDFCFTCFCELICARTDAVGRVFIANCVSFWRSCDFEAFNFLFCRKLSEKNCWSNALLYHSRARRRWSVVMPWKLKFHELELVCEFSSFSFSFEIFHALA